MGTKQFRATKVNETSIELITSTDLAELYKTIEAEENFILTWKEGSVKHAKLIIGNNLSSKVKNGDITLTAKQTGELQ